jgi:hypothetical protein
MPPGLLRRVPLRFLGRLPGGLPTRLRFTGAIRSQLFYGRSSVAERGRIRLPRRPGTLNAAGNGDRPFRLGIDEYPKLPQAQPHQQQQGRQDPGQMKRKF